MSYKKASGPMDRLEEAVKIARDQVDDLEAQGYSGPILKKWQGVHKRLWTAFAELEDILAKEDKEKQQISQEILEWREYAERIKEFASIKMEETALDLFPRIMSMEEIKDLKDTPPFNGEENTVRNHMLKSLREIEDDLPEETAERFRQFIEENHPE